ncbi:Zn-ribbon domain-containing OB-fold protein [Streptomyces hiroshimensis]|uniref:Zn-ribbon domain-containing OB-fold protein n=1 Tax=Streptomyces hiroshimensis TaxID=66424 RepID=UPI001673F9DF|nr:OB-fold domain-containing protein [Streptomyces hiroshimensis]
MPPRSATSRSAGPRAPRFDIPEVDAFTRPYWEAAGRGRLLIRRCRAAGCGLAHHYPREFCPRCWSEDVVWEAASGRAVLYTWSVVHVNDLPPFGGRVPYTAAVVDLAEGPRMMTEVVGCAESRLRIGMALTVRFRELEGARTEGEPPLCIPVFGVASDASPDTAPDAVTARAARSSSLPPQEGDGGS